MEIDPRLRSDTSSGGPYPPLHRGSGSSAPPALAPNPAHLSLQHQYPAGHHSPHQHPSYAPQTPQSIGHSGGADYAGSPNDGTPDDGGTNDPKRPRACEACRGLKVRCEFDSNNPNGPCKRCNKANRNCVVTVPSRKRLKKTDNRVAELEKKIDALTASLQASKSGPADHRSGNEAEQDGPIGGGIRPNQYEQVTNGSYGGGYETRHGSESWPTPDRYSKSTDNEGRQAAPPMVIAGQKRKYQDEKVAGYFNPGGAGPGTQPDKSRNIVLQPFLYGEFPEDAGAQRPDASNQYADVVDRGVISMEKATDMFNRYRDELAQHLPVVVFPPDTTAADIRKSKPTLFLAILCAGSGTDHPDVQRVLTKEAMQIYADRVICHGEKTLELVQALLVSTIWYWPPEHFEELKFYQLIHMAAVMALDINISKKSKHGKSNKPMANPGLWRDHPWRRTPFPDADSIEARRAWLGCYFMCAASAMGLRRPNLIRWSSYMTECVEVLETGTGPTTLSDKFLCQWVRSQRIAEEVGEQFCMDDPCASVNIADAKVQYALKGFERDLEHWSEQVPKDLRAPTLKMAEHVVNLYMHEVAMHVDHNVDEFKPPFTEESLRDSGLQDREDAAPLTSAHISALSTCLQSIDGVFDAFLSLQVDVIRCLPILYFVRIAYAVVVLIKMFFAAAKPNSELGKVIDKDNMKVESYLDSLLEKFRATAADDKSRPAAKFLMVLVMLKTWFHRSKAGKGALVKSEGGYADVDTPMQTPAASSNQAILQPVNHHHQQQAQHLDYSPANTPLQLLSEVATGTSRPESRSSRGYVPSSGSATAEWQAQLPSQQAQLAAGGPQPGSYQYPDANTGGFGMGFGAMGGNSNSNIDPALGGGGGGGGFPADFDFAIGAGFEQAMGMTLGEGDLGRYFQDDAFWNVMMDSVGAGGGAPGPAFEGL